MNADSEAAIRSLAEAVQGGNAHGPWGWQGGYPQRITNGAATLIAEVFDSPDAPPTLVEFIAACDPATILWLLAELAAAREALADTETCRLLCTPEAQAEVEKLRGLLREVLSWFEEAADDGGAADEMAERIRDLLADGEGET